MIPLPEQATPESAQLAELAVRLAALCPPALASEIALVGSVAHGFADADSDLELNLWADVIPPVEARVAWLAAAGAVEIQPESQPRPDDSYWISFRLEDIPGEVGWQTLPTLATQLDMILSGSVTDQKALAFADVIVSAIPLHTRGQLAAWLARLAGYSDVLQAKLIGMALERWSRPSAFGSLWRLARRGEVLALTEALLPEVDLALRVLYVAHRRWEPSRKWTLTLARTFAPPEIIEQINGVFSDPSLDRRVESCVALCRDVLALVPAEYDVSAAVEALAENDG